MFSPIFSGDLRNFLALQEVIADTHTSHSLLSMHAISSITFNTELLSLSEHLLETSPSDLYAGGCSPIIWRDTDVPDRSHPESPAGICLTMSPLRQHHHKRTLGDAPTSLQGTGSPQICAAYEKLH